MELTVKPQEPFLISTFWFLGFNLQFTASFLPVKDEEDVDGGKEEALRLAPSNRHAIPKWGANHWSSSPFQGPLSSLSLGGPMSSSLRLVFLFLFYSFLTSRGEEETILVSNGRALTIFLKELVARPMKPRSGSCL